MPLTLTGLTDYKGYGLFVSSGGKLKRVDQSVHGNDFWQTDYDAASRSWRQTYNIPLDTPGDAARTVRLVFRKYPADE